MEFRYRLSDEDVDPTTLAAAEEQYQARLSGIDLSGAGDLERFFRRDFFHDGIISSVRFDERMHNVVIDLTAYSFWIDGYRESALDGDSLAFRCTFADVAWMQMETRKIDENNDPLCELEKRVEFLRGEIDGLSDLIDRYNSNYGVAHHSLVIETCTPERNLALVFRRVTVAPADQAALDALLANPSVWTGLYPERTGD